MRKTTEILRSLNTYYENDMPMLAVFQVGSGRFRDKKGRFASPPRYIGRVNKTTEIDNHWTLWIDVISQVGGTHQPVNSPNISGECIMWGDQLVDIYRAGHYVSSSRFKSEQ